MGALLEVQELSVDIPLAAGVLHPVRNVSFSVGAAETLCIVGESGCGKSLTALALMGLLPRRAIRRARRLSLGGEDMLAADARRMAAIRGRRIAMIFQEPMTCLNPAWTIGNQLEEAYLCHNPGKRQAARERAVMLLERVGISAAASRLRQYPHQLSGGLRQRVMIAMALMCRPELIVADEPTTALDVTIQAQILLLLAELQREFRMGLVLITHDLGVVALIAHKVAVMYAGQVVEHGPAAALFAAPLHPYTRGLMQCIPVPGRTARGSRLGVIPGMVPNLIGEMHGCSFRDRCLHARGPCVHNVALRPAAPDDPHRYRCVLAPADAAARAALEAAP